MLFFAVILSLIPLAAIACSLLAAKGKNPWWLVALRFVLLFAVGLTTAIPFLTSRGVGSGEAQNYSLALADAVTQFRAGEVPFAGQTEFAFNGRVHPLRNAPYLFYLAGAIDAATGQQLSFWELQNLSLSFSLILAVFVCYGALRWGTNCPRPAALVLASLYGLAPPLLSLGNANLFMTVHAAAFVPLAVGACVRHCRNFSVLNDVVLAAALAATWLAHPPVALWLTVGTGFVRLLILGRNPSWQARLGLMGSTLLGLALAAFVFASVATLSSELGYFPAGEEVRASYLKTVMANLRSAFPGSLLPVSSGANRLADIQFGYAAWALLIVAIAGRVRFFREQGEAPAVRQVAGTGLLLATIAFLALTLPIPGLTPWLWEQVPTAVQNMTAIWPMQRLYLIALAFTIFAVALLFSEPWTSLKLPRRALAAVTTLCVLWTLWQASVFVRGGLALRWTEDNSRRAHLSSNLDLTLTSYAFLPLPPTFVNGVMDPLMEFRIVKSDGTEIDSPLRAAVATAPVTGRGEIFLREGPSGPIAEVRDPKLTLQPGRRYLVTFHFLTPPFQGTVKILGPSLLRDYTLPAAGQPRGFGMQPGSQRTISLWTALPRAEDVTVGLALGEKPATGPDGKIAEFTVQTVDPATLRVRVDNFLPLRCTVEAAEAGWYLATPRGYMPGYVASVNGRRVRPARAPDGQIMLPLVAGLNHVELRYVGPPLLRTAFQVSVAAWLGLLFLFATSYAGVRWREVTRRVVAAAMPTGKFLWRHKIAVLAMGCAASGTWFWWWQRTTYLESVGPIHLRVLFPTKQIGRNQPLVVTGKPGEGTNIFVSYIDNHHVRIGADIWGSLYQSEPIETDYFQEQDIVVNSSALYPLDHPRVRALSEDARRQLRQDFRVELNGRTVISQQRSAYESTVRQVTVGETRIGGSYTLPKFTGQILAVKRLPPPSRAVVGSGQPLRLQLRFPANRTGTTETLVALGHTGKEGALTATYLSKTRVLLAHRAGDGTVVASAERPISPGRSHALVLNFGRPNERATPSIAAEFEGRKIFGHEKLETTDQPMAVRIGLAHSAISGVEERFTGSEIALVADDPRPAHASAEAFGAVRLLVLLPTDKLGRPEPLLTTGRTGAGDFAYIIYVDAGHVRFGLDHWGVGGGVSEPVAIDYAAPHAIEIRQGALYPEETHAFWKNTPPEIRRQRKSEMEILLDGRSVFKGPWPAHPSTAAEITPGENRIGGSNCDPAFTGQIFSVERMPVR